MIREILKARQIPDLLTFIDGAPVQTAEDWSLRRKELLSLLLHTEYGLLPDKSPVMAEQIYDPIDESTFVEMANMEYYLLSFEVDNVTYRFPLRLIYPKNKLRVPYFITLSFRPAPFDRYLPTEEILDRGYGIALLDYQQVSPDRPTFEYGIGKLSDRSKPDSPGKLMLWAYAAMRTADFLLSRPETDPTDLAVIGHSRLGKTALLTGALDERFHFIFANCSGCSGDALFRGKCGEHISDITSRFPFWFCPSFREYANREYDLPFDQHALLALVAPRHLVLGSAAEDQWADPVSQYLSLCAADPVFRLLGQAGFKHPDRLPAVGDRFTEGSVGFHMRSGAHFLYRTDWISYMDFRKAKAKS